MAVIFQLIRCNSSNFFCPPLPKRLSVPGSGAGAELTGFLNGGLYPLLLNGAAITCSSYIS
ncbi:MAG: hypothetical protein WCP52_01575 [Bacteroidota bacterium]